MPDLRAVPLTALSTTYLAGEKVDTAVPAPTLLSTLQFLLNQFKHLRLNDSFVVALHIVLRDLALVDLFLLCEEVHRVALLQERIALVFLVGEDAANRSRIPFILAARRLDAVGGQPGGDAVRRHTLQEHTVDAADDDRFVLIQNQIAVRTPVVAEEPFEGYGDLSVCKPFSLAPGAVLRNAAAFLLCQ